MEDWEKKRLKKEISNRINSGLFGILPFAFWYAKKESIENSILSFLINFFCAYAVYGFVYLLFSEIMFDRLQMISDGEKTWPTVVKAVLIGMFVCSCVYGRIYS